MSRAETYWTRDDIMRRWRYDPKDERDCRRFRNLIWRLTSGRHPSHAMLSPTPLNGDLFDPAEVLAVEEALKTWRQKSAA